MRAPGLFRPSLVLALALSLLVSSCTRQPPTAPAAGARSLSSASLSARLSGIAAEGTFEGDIGPGAHYVISVPENWNGDLVLYAHGYTAPIFPVGVPPGEEVLVDGLRALALQGGLAFAYSSYSQTGLGLKDASLRTEQLANIFTSLVGSPRRTFLVGTSFGALAALKLVEAHPERYAGLLSLSGMIGGVRAEVDYISNVRALFDYFYPGVLQGNVLELPPGFDLTTDLIVPVANAIQTNPQPALELAQVTQTPIPFSNGQELAQSIIQALVLQAVELQDLLERTHGQSFFDNTQTVYTGNLPPELLADLNAQVERYSEGQAAARLLEKYYDPTGDLRIPMVSLHTTLDPVVPIFHEDLYRSQVEAHGELADLLQIRIDRYGHVAFTPEEIVSAFGQMIASAPSP
jgi:pimeloyl-ACP methyl ester carboxylesterase